MENYEIRNRLLISTQRALLGNIYSDILGIIVDFDGIKSLSIKCFLNREPNELDYDNISEIAGEILSDIDFEEVNELCEYYEGNLKSIDQKGIWVYIRK